MQPGTEFEGVIGKTVAESEPWWPPSPAPPRASPNIIAIVLDDTGFAHLGCYGSTIETPHIDRLAANGLATRTFTPRRSAPPLALAC